MSKIQYTGCPFCKQVVEVDISWAIRNERIFCGSCCKSFPIRVGEETEDEPPKKEEHTVAEKFDEGIKKIFDDDDDTGYDWDEF